MTLYTSVDLRFGLKLCSIWTRKVTHTLTFAFVTYLAAATMKYTVTIKKIVVFSLCNLFVQKFNATMAALALRISFALLSKEKMYTLAIV